MIAPPPGSAISVVTEGDGAMVSIPYRVGPLLQMLRLVMLFAVGLCAFGFIAAVVAMAIGINNVSVLVSLGTWPLAGLYATYLVGRLFRPAMPEMLWITPDELVHSSGIPPHRIGRDDLDRPESWQSLMDRCVIHQLDRKQLRSLQLRPVNRSNRLTVDTGATHIDIATSATAVEREWLYRLLVDTYGAPRNAAAAPGAAE